MKTAISTLILCVGSLMGLGIVMLYSNSMARGGTHYLTMQSAWSIAGIGLCLVAAFFDYRWLKRFSGVFLALAVLALIAVLFPGIGVWKNGSRRWFSLGVANFQPSEAAKLALIIALAWYGERYQRDIRTFW